MMNKVFITGALLLSSVAFAREDYEDKAQALATRLLAQAHIAAGDVRVSRLPADRLGVKIHGIFNSSVNFRDIQNYSVFFQTVNGDHTLLHYGCILNVNSAMKVGTISDCVVRVVNMTDPIAAGPLDP